MKKRFGVAALTLAAGCAVIFAGCTGCNGCGNNGKANEAAFSSNWYADTNFKYIQPSFLGEDKAEVVQYTVKHDKEPAGNTTYSVDYSDGTYTTTFYGATFQKDLIDGDYKDGYPDESISVYCYKTELDVPEVTFTVGDKTSEAFHNNIKTVSYFTSVNEHLRPLYSEQTVNAVSPAEYQVSSLDEAYVKVNQTVKTSYNYEGTAAKTVITGDGAKEFVTNGLGDTDNSLIDVSGLNIAVRAMQLSDSFSQVVSVYSPAGKLQNYTFSGSSAGLSETERTACEEVLKGKALLVEGKSLHTVCVTATLNSDMKGVSQKYWFAAIDNARNNTGRTTMVKMSVPIPFSLGTLNYSLKEITNTLYNGQ